MADLIITANSVVRDTTAKQPTHGIAGVGLTAGQSIVKDPTTGKYVLADNNHATPALRKPDGIALNPAAVDQPVAIHTEGKITIGAATVVGTTYVQSATPGGIAPAADLVSGNEVTHVGVATSTTQIDVKLNKSGAVVP